MNQADPGSIEGARDRVLGRLGGSTHGPTLLVTTAIHGNEVAGVRAARRVLSDLAGLPSAALLGRLIVLVGNLAALRLRTRFVDVDLNRQWTPQKVDAILAAGASGVAEHVEQRELLAVVRAEVALARGPVYLLDLHTSSADGPPFLTVGDTLVNRRFAGEVPLPKILGLEEQVDGSLLEYLNNRGVVTLGVEGGQHDAPHAADRLEAVLRLALAASRVVDPGALTRLGDLRRFLADETGDIPSVIEVRHRHAIRAGDEFRMEPGFRNFQPVRRGQLLARDRRGAVLCPESGLILLPLYQGQGDDGFFVARAVRPLWLAVSALLRRARAETLVRRLPGVRAHPVADGILIADTRIARYYPLEVFHLMGFRKLRREGIHLTVSRRNHDLRSPTRIEL